MNLREYLESQLGLKRRNTATTTGSVMADFKLAKGSTPVEVDITEEIKENKRPPVAALTFQRGNISQRGENRNRANVNFDSPHINLDELAKARDTECLINTSVERHIETALQEGFRFTCQDEEILDYVKKRIFEIEFVSMLTMRKVLEMLMDQLVTYGTGFIIVRRDRGKSSGKRFRLFGRDYDPISSWGVPDSSTMYSAENSEGNVISWKQVIFERDVQKETKYQHSDVFVFTRHKQAGRVFGRSMYLPSLDDVLMLRSLEDLVYVISQKYAFPLFQYIVGTKERPAEDVVDPVTGELISEVELARITVDNMPVEGGFVTPERHEIKLIGTEGKVLDLTPYLDHFKTRVQESTRMSNAALGTGKGEQSKSVGQTQLQNLEKSAKYIQDIVSDGFHWILVQLMADGAKDVNEINLVRLVFSPPDTEEQRAHENHIMSQYQTDLLTGEEARKSLGRKPFEEKSKQDLYSNQQHERDKDLAKIGAAARAASSSAKKTKSAKKSTSSKTRPTNQSGKKATKTKVKKNDYIGAMNKVWSEAKATALQHSPVSTEKSYGFNRVLSIHVDSMEKVSKVYLSSIVDEAVTEVRTLLRNSSIFVSLGQRKAIFHTVRQALKKHMNDTVSEKFKTGDKTIINASFDINKNRFISLIESNIDFVYNAAYLAALNNSGIPEAKITDTETGCSVTILTKDYSSKAVQYLKESHEISYPESS